MNQQNPPEHGVVTNSPLAGKLREALEPLIARSEAAGAKIDVQLALFHELLAHPESVDHPVEPAAEFRRAAEERIEAHRRNPFIADPPALPAAGVSDEAVDAAARVLAEQFAKNPPVNGSKDFRIDARAALDAVRAIHTAAEEAGK